MFVLYRLLLNGSMEKYFASGRMDVAKSSKKSTTLLLSAWSCSLLNRVFYSVDHNSAAAFEYIVNLGLSMAVLMEMACPWRTDGYTRRHIAGWSGGRGEERMPCQLAPPRVGE